MTATADARIAAMPAPSSTTSPARDDFAIRPAVRADVAAIVRLIHGLAEFEKLTHLVQVTPESLAPHLFGARPVAEALVAERAGRVVAFALFFTNFSTFLALPGLYLEDLFVEPQARGQGIGQALLEHLARLAATRGCGRFEWSVLDWNEGAIRFYQRMGATVMPDWRICRIAGPALAAFADPPRG
jgi:GNAT superfamily N-acetyltransferase